MTEANHPMDREHFELYWFGDLDADAAAELEAHLFTCTACATQAERYATELTAIQRATDPLPKAHLTADEVARMAGSVVVQLPTESRPEGRHELHLQSGAVHVFQVQLAEEVRSTLERLDVEYTVAGVADPVFHVSDVPVPKAGDSVFLACHGHVLQSHGDAVMRVIGTRAGQRVTVYESEMHFVGA
jgi:hypothetical protein